MAALVACSSCGGFMRPTDAACPHCERPAAPVRKALLGLVALCGGGAFAVTLMACYGLPPCDGKPGCYPPDLSNTPADGGADAGVVDMKHGG